VNHIQLKEGRGLGELAPAPMFADAWKKPEAAPIVLAVATNARARLVRVWAMQLFQREHSNFPVPLEIILRLLEHEDAEVQQFGAKMLETSSALATLPVSEWFEIVADQKRRSIATGLRRVRQTCLGRSAGLAAMHRARQCAPVPVARLGQRYLKDRVISSAADREQISSLADAKCAAIAGELASWALAILGTKEHYVNGQVIRFSTAHWLKPAWPRGPGWWPGRRLFMTPLLEPVGGDSLRRYSFAGH